MPSDFTLFAGMEFSSGRKPVTLAVLDADLKIVCLETGEVGAALSRLAEYENAWLAASRPALRSGQDALVNFKQGIARAGFKSLLEGSHPKQWLETDSQDCFQRLSGHKLLPRRSLEGRLQRSAILYEQGLPVTDPMDIFEEITRFKLIQGQLPLDGLPTSRELDALVAAYLAWLVVNRPRQTQAQGAFVLPEKE
jgi:hypothetical protein